MARKPFDDVDSQEGVSDSQHHAASKGGTTPGHSCHMHLLLQCYNASCYNATMPPANLSLDQERGQLPPLASLAVSILLLDLFFLSTSHFGNIPILYQQNATKTEVETYSKPNWIKEQLH